MPFSPFGNATVLRAIAPHILGFLYALSESDGADQTRTGPSLGKPERNGEAFGEIGVVTHGDANWRNQTGAPADDQPGISRGGKDTRR